MPAVYLINVGANAAGASIAKSPVFSDGSFVFVPFSVSDDLTQARQYPERCKQFVNPDYRERPIAHDDPDWGNKTYGDCLIQSRSSNLSRVVIGDVLLFWGRLWAHSGHNGWKGFRSSAVRKSGNRNKTGAYLLGALRVHKVIRAQNGEENLSEQEVRRIKVAIQYPPCYHDIVFLAHDDDAYSGLFPKAVPLEEARCPDGLLYRCFQKKNGNQILLQDWMGALRTCRKVMEADESERSLTLARAIYEATDGRFNILSGIVPWT